MSSATRRTLIMNSKHSGKSDKAEVQLDNLWSIALALAFAGIGVLAVGARVHSVFLWLGGLLIACSLLVSAFLVLVHTLRLVFVGKGEE